MKHKDAKQDMSMAKRAAKVEVGKHEDKMHKGQKMVKLADGGMVDCGHRSNQDYGKK